MLCLVEIVFSHCVVIFDRYTPSHHYQSSSLYYCLQYELQFKVTYSASQKISLRKGAKYLKHCPTKHL